jgi:hypothetical protein
VLLFVRSKLHHSSTMAVRVTVQPPTLSSTASFGSGSCILLKRILQEPYHSRPFVVMLRRSLCCFSWGQKLHHSSTMAVRVTVQATDAFKYCASVQVAGILLKRILQEPYLSRPFVVMLRRSLCCFSWGQAKLHHSSTMAVRVTVQATDAFKYCASVQVAGILLKRILQEPYLSRPFVVMLRRSLCCFSWGQAKPHSSTMAVRVTVQATDAFKYCKLRFR